MSEFRTVCRVGDVVEGEGRTVAVGDKLIAVFLEGGQYYAIDDCCPHMGASLSEGYFKGMERLLKDKPADGETWTFVRGQALLVGEAGNLLMLRPPKNGGQDAWMDRAAELRESATALARAAAARDFDKSQRALVSLANVCNRCHQTFRAPVRIEPF